MAAKLKKGDTVVVLTGKDKGKKGEISSVNPDANKAIVDGVNVAIRHTKQSAQNQAGRQPKAKPAPGAAPVPGAAQAPIVGTPLKPSNSLERTRP